MEIVPEEQLVQWLELNRLEAVSAWAGSYEIRYAGIEQQRAFWMFPRDPDGYERFICAFLDAIDPWNAILLVPRDRVWPAKDDEWEHPQSPRVKIMNCFDSRRAWRGAIRFPREERSTVIAFVFAHMLTAMHPNDDLYLIGDSADNVIYVDSERAIHVISRTDTRLDAVVSEVSGRGFHLPEEVPCIFKWPESMARQYRKR